MAAWTKASASPKTAPRTAFLDLRVDLQLLSDHFTLTALAEAIRHHPLAVVVLLFAPSLWRRYRG